MQRYFASIVDNKAKLTDGDVHHLLHVMRTRLHEHIVVVDNGRSYECEVLSFNPLNIPVIQSLKDESELPFPLTLIFPLAKGDKIEFVLQKATELGVNAIYLVSTKRCVVKMDQESFNKKKARYDKIIQEAAEQSHRLSLPYLYGVYDLSTLPEAALSLHNYVAYEKLAGEGQLFGFPQEKSSLTYFVGPEGGFEDEEIAGLEKRGFQSVSLGKRILRCETAALYGLCVLGYWLEK